MTSTLHEYAGVIHAHSTYSDGGGDVDEILSAAEDAVIDYLILTDHNTLDARVSGYEGWHNQTLLIVGDEVSSRHGHCLALGTSTHVEHRQAAEGVLADIRAQGGDAYIAHPHGRYRPFLRLRDHSWKDWQANDFTGLELWSYMFDWATAFHYAKFLDHYRYPDKQIRGPSPETVGLWDELCQDRRVVAIGGVDAHARTYSLLPIVVFPYRQQFGTLRTHILCGKLSGQSESDIPQVLNAISEGSCFLSYDGLSDASGTRFEAVDGSVAMGTESEYGSELELGIHLPEPAELSIVRDGRIEERVITAEMTYTADRPGVYRMEARLEGRPWIFTNPIYLRRTVDKEDK